MVMMTNDDEVADPHNCSAECIERHCAAGPPVVVPQAEIDARVADARALVKLNAAVGWVPIVAALADQLDEARRVPAAEPR